MPNNYLAYLGFAVLVVLAPGPDFAVVTKNCLIHGRRGRLPGLATSLGVVTSLIVQGIAAAAGVAALVVRSEIIFNVIKYVGAAYLGYLGIQALVSAIRRRSGNAGPEEVRNGGDASTPLRTILLKAFRQGFLSNISNPKVLAFYFSLLPQFVDTHKAVAFQVGLLAFTHALLALMWLFCVVLVLDRLSALVQRPAVRRSIEGLTGVALIGFGVRLMTSSSA
ncbi:LysE family translocator [Actinoplanes sp. NPDC051851]|uniref:LysE family translocator n=1 Tax=Actinoplanes sp. NPDC051851 TaxID=3154753 RepID=UPI0034459D59